MNTISISLDLQNNKLDNKFSPIVEELVYSDSSEHSNLETKEELVNRLIKLKEQLKVKAIEYSQVQKKLSEVDNEKNLLKNYVDNLLQSKAIA